jgi:hypothetical protein
MPGAIAPLARQVPMSKAKPGSPAVSSLASPPTLADRVKGRVAEAQLAIDNHVAAPAAKGGAPRPPRRGKHPLHQEGELQASRSLRRVYGEMKSTYQQYRRESGRPVVPELREAVHAFKRGPSLTALVGIAAFLDERGLLTW